MTQQILVGYDGRPESDDALDLAIVIAETLEATLVVGGISPKRSLLSRGSWSDRDSRRAHERTTAKHG
jgi:nucleotide-binding universal stress UspA family protein